MWGSIPYHAHNFLIRFAIGVRTTIELMKNQGNISKKQFQLFFLYYYMLNSGADTKCETNQKIVGMAGN